MQPYYSRIMCLMHVDGFMARVFDQEHERKLKSIDTLKKNVNFLAKKQMNPKVLIT